MEIQFVMDPVRRLNETMPIEIGPSEAPSIQQETAGPALSLLEDKRDTPPSMMEEKMDFVPRTMSGVKNSLCGVEDKLYGSMNYPPERLREDKKFKNVSEMHWWRKGQWAASVVCGIV